MEKKVYAELKYLLTDVFLPLRKVERQWHDRKKMLDMALFPNYVFVKLLPEEMWRVLNVKGVVQFVAFAGEPAVVREAEIEMINRLLESRMDIAHENWCRIGEKVKVVCGPFEGLEGIVKEQKGAMRLYVELPAIRQVLSVEMPRYQLERCM